MKFECKQITQQPLQQQLPQQLSPLRGLQVPYRELLYHQCLQDHHQDRAQGEYLRSDPTGSFGHRRSYVRFLRLHQARLRCGTDHCSDGSATAIMW